MLKSAYRRSRTRTWCLVAMMALSVTGGVVTNRDHQVAAQDLSGGPWNLIPGDATALISINTDPASPQWAMADRLLGNVGLREVVDGYLGEVLSELGLPPSTLDPKQSPLLGGSVTVATWSSTKDQPSPAALYLVAADSEAALRSLQAQIFPGDGADTLEVPVQAGRLMAQEGSIAGLLIVDGVIVLGDLETLTTIADLAVGSGPSLAQFEPFRRVMAAQSVDLIARIYANGPGAGRALASRLSSFGLGPSEFAALLTLGIPLAASYTSLGISAAPEGVRIRAAQLPAPIIGPPLPTAPAEGLSATVSANSALFVAGNDLGDRLIFSQLLDSFVIATAASIGKPPNGPTLDVPSWAYASIKDATGIDLRADLLDQLKGDFVVAATIGALGPMGGIDLVIRSDVSDADAVQRVIDNLAVRLRFAAADPDSAAGYLEFASLKEGTDTRYVLTVTDYDGSGEDLTLSFGLKDGRLEAAINDGESLLSPAGPSLADDPGFLAVMELLPDGEGSRFYLDAHQLIDLAGLATMQPRAHWNLPDEQFALLGNIQALGGLTYTGDGLAITEIVLSTATAMATPVSVT